MARSGIRFAQVCGVVVACAGMTFAQPVETLTFSIEWDKAVIAPGETNSGKVVATIGPELGTVTQWNSSPGTGQPGVLKALASLGLDFKNLSNGTNGSLSWKVNPDWWPGSGIPPTPDGQGGIAGIQFGQISPPLEPFPNLSAVIDVVTVKWTAAVSPMPAMPYEVMYGTKALWAKVFLDIGLPSGQWVGENAVKIDGQGGFTVIPSPSVFAFGVFALGVFVQRRRLS